MTHFASIGKYEIGNRELMSVYAELTHWEEGEGVRLPAAVMERIGLSAGDSVEIVRQGDAIVIRKAERTEKGASYGRESGV